MTGRDFDAERRQILRRITLLTWGLWGMVALMAVAGGAVLAWMFRGVAGVSFATAWLLAALGLVAIPALIHGVGRLVVSRREDRRGDGE